MSSSANVLAIHALDELKGALARFGGEAREALEAAGREIRRTLEWLEERHAHWQREVRRRQEDVRRARAALERCQASARYDPQTGRHHVPDCGRYEHALHEAQSHLREAEAELKNVRQWSRQVQQAASDYRRQAQRLTGMLNDDLPKAAALLDRKSTDLRLYTMATAPSGGYGPTLRERSSTGGGAPLWHITGSSEAVQRLQKALSRLTETEVGQSIGEVIRERGTTIRFGQIEAGVVAYFDPADNEIVINDRLQDASSAVLAAHLAHEGTHVEWNTEDSIEQEYYAFNAQAEVWNALKGDETDRQCDWVSWMISLGERQAKRRIRRLYPELPTST
ncbi:MAG: hypothetical protein MAG451_01616 [Anaerolineales bacterium]|nr:hypothetical protein [Anaerolineales bacterium]